MVQTAQDVQQRALPDAGGSDDRDHLSGLDSQIQVAEDRQGTPANDVALPDAPGLEKTHSTLLIPQRLRRIEARGLARRVDGREEADEHGADHHQREVER